MPSADTFDIEPIGQIIKRYLRQSSVSIDPFSRNKRWATYTNDLNPDTSAEYHLEAFEFLELILNQGVKADLVIFDPPYSHYQVKEVYQGVGKEYRFDVEAANTGHWSKEKKIINQLLLPGGFFIHCGWHSNGLGKKYNTEITEILLVAHGRSHNDTIVTVEQKKGHQLGLFNTQYNNHLQANG